MMRPEHQGIVLLVAIVLVMSVVKIMQIGFAISDLAAIATNFEQCVAIGNPIMETHPRQCQSAGKNFVEATGNAESDVALTL